MVSKKQESTTRPPYNPLDKKNLGTSVAEALLQQELVALPPSSFNGAGVYAIYYTGSFAAYEPIRIERAAEGPGVPIYVGKAVPKGTRKGLQVASAQSGRSLYERLQKHANSVDQVGLGRENFRCRYLVVDDIWIPLGETLLIDMFRPLWNVLLDGFGNNTPGRGRKDGEISRWDTVHPGRPWVKGLDLPPNKKNKTAWIKEIRKFFDTGESSDLVMEDEVGYSAEEDAE